jgi:hypothetical protein
MLCLRLWGWSRGVDRHAEFTLKSIDIYRALLPTQQAYAEFQILRAEFAESTGSPSPDALGDIAILDW